MKGKETKHRRQASDSDDSSSGYSSPSWGKLHTIPPASDLDDDEETHHVLGKRKADELSTSAVPVIRSVGRRKTKKNIVESSEDEGTGEAGSTETLRGHNSTAISSQSAIDSGESLTKTPTDIFNALQAINLKWSIKALREAIVDAGLVIPGKIKSRKDIVQFITASIVDEGFDTAGETYRLNTRRQVIKGRELCRCRRGKFEHHLQGRILMTLLWALHAEREKTQRELARVKERGFNIFKRRTQTHCK